MVVLLSETKADNLGQRFAYRLRRLAPRLCKVRIAIGFSVRRDILGDTAETAKDGFEVVIINHVLEGIEKMYGAH
jgi:hypothetical protein